MYKAGDNIKQYDTARMVRMLDTCLSLHVAGGNTCASSGGTVVISRAQKANSFKVSRLAKLTIAGGYVPIAVVEVIDNKQQCHELHLYCTESEYRSLQDMFEVDNNVWLTIKEKDK